MLKSQIINYHSEDHNNCAESTITRKITANSVNICSPEACIPPSPNLYPTLKLRQSE